MPNGIWSRRDEGRRVDQLKRRCGQSSTPSQPFQPLEHKSTTTGCGLYILPLQSPETPSLYQFQVSLLPKRVSSYKGVKIIGCRKWATSTITAAARRNSPFCWGKGRARSASIGDALQARSTLLLVLLYALPRLLIKSELPVFLGRYEQPSKRLAD